MKRSIVLAACFALAAAPRLTADTRDGEVRLPYLKFPRNPEQP